MEIFDTQTLLHIITIFLIGGYMKMVRLLSMINENAWIISRILQGDPPTAEELREKESWWERY